MYYFNFLIKAYLHKQAALWPTKTRLFRVLGIYNFGSGLTEAEEWDSKPAAALALQTPTFLIRYSLVTTQFSVCIVPTSFSQSLELENEVWNSRQEPLGILVVLGLGDKRNELHFQYKWSSHKITKNVVM